MGGRRRGRSGEEKGEISELNSCMLHKLARETQTCTTRPLKCYRPVVYECVPCCLQELCKPAALQTVDQKSPQSIKAKGGLCLHFCLTSVWPRFL